MVLLFFFFFSFLTNTLFERGLSLNLETQNRFENIEEILEDLLFGLILLSFHSLRDVNKFITGVHEMQS